MAPLHSLQSKQAPISWPAVHQICQYRPYAASSAVVITTSVPADLMLCQGYLPCLGLVNVNTDLEQPEIRWNAALKEMGLGQTFAPPQLVDRNGCCSSGESSADTSQACTQKRVIIWVESA